MVIDNTCSDWTKIISEGNTMTIDFEIKKNDLKVI